MLGIFLFLAQRKIILIFAPEKIAKLYQNKKIGGDEAIFFAKQGVKSAAYLGVCEEFDYRRLVEKESIGTI